MEEQAIHMSSVNSHNDGVWNKTAKYYKFN